MNIKINVLTIGWSGLISFSCVLGDNGDAKSRFVSAIIFLGKKSQTIRVKSISVTAAQLSKIWYI